MVAANATAIRFDINLLSAFASSAPIQGLQIRATLRRADTFLTARVNRMVSTRRCRMRAQRGEKEKLQLK